MRSDLMDQEWAIIGESLPPDLTLEKRIARTALIVGAGDNLGAAIVCRFGREGLHVVATRRRRDFSSLVDRVRDAGGSATGIYLDARDEQAVADLIKSVEADIGPIAVCVFNVGGNVRFPIADTTARVYRRVWEMCAFAGFLVGKEVAQVMRPRGRGTILFTGALASLRGQSGYSAFAGEKHALRALAQSPRVMTAPRLSWRASFAGGLQEADFSSYRAVPDDPGDPPH